MTCPVDTGQTFLQTGQISRQEKEETDGRFRRLRKDTATERLS